MKILITGGSGYIALNLINYLKKYPNTTVDTVDKILNIKAENIKSIENYDAVVHLAAVSGIAKCEENIEESIKDNIFSAFNIFNLSKRKKIPVIFTSSQAAKTPKDNIYAMQKRIVEIKAEELNKKNKTDIKILRLTNVYGGLFYLKRKDTVIKRIVDCKRYNENFNIYGDGNQIRDFIHVDDVCKAIYKCIVSDLKIKYPIDIGTGIGTSILQLVKMSKNNFIFDYNNKMVGTKKNVANIFNAKNILNFKSDLKIENYLNNFNLQY